MICSILEKNVIIQNECREDRFLLFHCEHNENMDIIAAVTEKDIIYIIISIDSVQAPIVSRITPKRPLVSGIKINIKKYCLSVVFGDDSICIYSLVPLVVQYMPHLLLGLVPISSYPADRIGIKQGSFDSNSQHILFEAQCAPIIESFWWHPNNSNGILVTIERDGIRIIHVFSKSIKSEFYPAKNTYKAYSLTKNDLFYLFLISITNECTKYTFKYEDGSNHISKCCFPICLSANNPFCIQTSQGFSNPKWDLAILQKSLILYDSYANIIRDVPISMNRMALKSFAITNNLFFYSNRDQIIPSFIKNPSSNEGSFINEAIGVQSYVPDKNHVVVLTPSSIITVKTKEEPEALFREFVNQGDWKKSMLISIGFDISPSSECEKIAVQLLQESKSFEAYCVFKEGSCDLLNIIRYLIQYGCDSLALEIVLEYLSGQAANTQISTNELKQMRIILSNILHNKRQLFLAYHQYHICSFQEESLLSLTNAKSKSIISNPMLFRYSIENRHEDEIVKYLPYSTKIDHVVIPSSLSSSAQYLLNAYSSSLSITYSELMISNPKKVFQIDNGIVYISGKRLFVSSSFFIQDHEVFDFVVWKTKIFLINSNNYVYEYCYSTHKCQILEKANPSWKMSCNSNMIGIINISGRVQFFNDDVFHIINGNFIDMAMSDQMVLLLDSDGKVYMYENQTITCIYKDHFIISIGTVGSCLVLLLPTNEVIVIVNGVYQKFLINFAVSMMKSLDKVYIGGDGNILTIDIDGTIVHFDYINRIGDLIDISIINGEIYVVGSAAPPMRVSPIEIKPEKPDFSILSILVEQYPKEYLLSLFQNPYYNLLLHVICQNWNSVFESSVLSSIVEYLPLFDKERTINAIHVLFQRKICIPNMYLTDVTIRLLLSRYPSDYSTIGSAKVIQMLKSSEKANNTNFFDTFMRILPKTRVYSRVGSYQLQESNNVISFGCGHTLSQDEMKKSIHLVEAICKNRKILLSINEAYEKKRIPANCPNCLYRSLREQYGIIE